MSLGRFNHSISARVFRGIVRKNGIWDRLVFNALQNNMGGQLRLMITGSAPLAANVLTFMRCALGCIVSGADTQLFLFFFSFFCRTFSVLREYSLNLAQPSSSSALPESFPAAAAPEGDSAAFSLPGSNRILIENAAHSNRCIICVFMNSYELHKKKKNKQKPLVEIL